MEVSGFPQVLTLPSTLLRAYGQVLGHCCANSILEIILVVELLPHWSGSLHPRLFGLSAIVADLAAVIVVRWPAPFVWATTWASKERLTGCGRVSCTCDIILGACGLGPVGLGAALR